MVQLEKGYATPHVNNPHDHIYKVNAGAILANFTVLTHHQTKHVKPKAPELFSILAQHPGDATALKNQLFQDEATTTKRRWYPKPQTCQDPQTLNPLERRIYDAIVNIWQQAKMEPTISNDQRQTFLSRFNWFASQLITDVGAPVESLLAKNHNILQVIE